MFSRLLPAILPQSPLIQWTPQEAQTFQESGKPWDAEGPTVIFMLAVRKHLPEGSKLEFGRHTIDWTEPGLISGATRWVAGEGRLNYRHMPLAITKALSVAPPEKHDFQKQNPPINQIYIKAIEALIAVQKGYQFKPSLPFGKDTERELKALAQTSRRATEQAKLPINMADDKSCAAIENAIFLIKEALIQGPTPSQKQPLKKHRAHYTNEDFQRVWTIFSRAREERLTPGLLMELRGLCLHKVELFQDLDQEDFSSPDEETSTPPKKQQSTSDNRPSVQYVEEETEEEFENKPRASSHASVATPKSPQIPTSSPISLQHEEATEESQTKSRASSHEAAITPHSPQIPTSSPISLQHEEEATKEFSSEREASSHAPTAALQNSPAENPPVNDSEDFEDLVDTANQPVESHDSLPKSEPPLPKKINAPKEKISLPKESRAKNQNESAPKNQGHQNQGQQRNQSGRT